MAGLLLPVRLLFVEFVSDNWFGSLGVITAVSMTEEEIIDLMIAEDENQAYQMLSGILVGVGFLLVLISFGARRKKGSAKKTEKKPAE